MKDSVVIWKTGNSHVITVSPVILRELGLSNGDAVEVDIRRVKRNGS